MASPRLATYSVRGATRYGSVTEAGIVDLSARFGKDYPTLREAIAAGALMKLAEDAARRSPDHALDAITWQPPIPAPEKIICIGVNYPDRNAEYKDGTDAPKYRACSCGRRAPLSATTRRWCDRARRRSSTMRASWC
jgi:2-keto-4-pentenoate hydratase/2-oxohepta-3-ene-1,7-dioic acid hydratase in catechol pathway